MSKRRGPLVLLVFAAAGLAACRAVIGIEDDLTVADAGSPDSPSGGDAGGDGRSPSGDAGGGGNDPVVADCLGRGAGCVACCKTELATEWATVLQTLKENCICGPPDASLCGPKCAGQPECASSGGQSTPADCAACIEQAIVGSSPLCAQHKANCSAEPGCQRAVRCVQSCAR